MKLLITLIVLGFSALTPTTTFASQTDKDFPQAYAGLNPNAYHRIELNQSKSNQLSFQLQGATIPIQLPASNDSKQLTDNTSFTHSIPNGSISATKGTNSLFGQMHLNNKHYILTTNQSGIWAVELPESGLTYNDCGFDHKEHPAVAKNTTTALQPIDKVAGTVIDVLMIYDQAIADRYPGDLLQTRVDQYFNVSNQTYANSAIDLAIRQVGLEQVGYDFNDANINARNLIQQSLNLGLGAQGFENVPQLRNTTGADLVIFLRTHDIETRGNCGVAFFPFAPTNNNFDASYGVNIMADGMSSWSICTDQLMVHEIGHNLGAGHHNADPASYGFPVYSKGFAKLGQFGTAMGSFGTGNPDRFLELNYFSNPNVQCGGGPCGVPGQRDNATIISQLMGAVSNYKSSSSNAANPPDFTVALIDQDGDGVLDRDDEFPFDSTETSDSDGDGVGNNQDAFPTNASEQADFDGDGMGNNSDFDDDNDGILDSDDDFPFNKDEVKDTDGDGIGDIADEFVFDADENLDSDGDGEGNYADTDDDNDGIVDLSSDKQDLLVINVGNNRILRFDAQTGLPKGIEVLPNDGWLTFQSDLVVDHRTQVLYYSTNSSIKFLDLMDQNAIPSLLIPAFNSDQAQLGTGFPTALEIDEATQTLAVAKLNRTGVDSYLYNKFTNTVQSFLGFLANTESENIIDFYRSAEGIFALGQENKVYRVNDSAFVFSENFQIVGNGNMSWLVDPYAFVVTDETLLIHTDQERNKLVKTDGNDGSFEGIFADLTELGYSNPTGIEITDDGRLLVAVSDQNTVLEFDLATEEFTGTLINGLGLNEPHKMILVPQLQDRFHQDADKVIRPNAGNWYNPASSGRGFNVGIFNNRLQVLWFTYDEQGSPVWYTSAGLLDDHTYTAELLKTHLSSENELSFETVGEISMDFDNEREALVSWQIGEVNGSESLIWLQASGEPETADYTGMWSRPDTPGWGVAVSTVGDISFAIPFIYDELGEPRWAISDVFIGTQPLEFNMDTVFSEGLCPTCSGPISSTRVLSGTTTLNLAADDASWSSAFMWADPVPGSWQLDETEIIRISSPPTRPR